MRRSFRQLRDLQREHQCSVVVDGDFFDRWASPPECVNFLLRELPDDCYGIPGNHDLPFHDLKAIKRTAFWTLVEAGKVQMLPAGEVVELMVHGDAIGLHGFPFGTEITPANGHDLLLEVAVCHRYIWTEGLGFDGAPREQHVDSLRKSLKGYDVAVFGDNHTPFKTKVGRCTVVNTGGFFRRKADEILLRPSVWLIHKDGSVVRHKLKVDLDRFVENVEDLLTTGPNMEAFLEELQGLGDAAVNFEEALRLALERHNVRKGTRDVILKILEECKE